MLILLLTEMIQETDQQKWSKKQITMLFLHHFNTGHILPYKVVGKFPNHPFYLPHQRFGNC